MRKLALLSLIVVPLSALAKDKPVYQYQDGVLRSVRTIVTGSSCTGNANITATSYGNHAQGVTTGTADCEDDERFVYTVHVGDIDYELLPTHVVPFSGLVHRGSSLQNSLPGTRVQVRTDGGAFYARVKNRESRYRVYAAH
jgi:hypothetical protein